MFAWDWRKSPMDGDSADILAKVAAGCDDTDNPRSSGDEHSEQDGLENGSSPVKAATEPVQAEADDDDAPLLGAQTGTDDIDIEVVTGETVMLPLKTELKLMAGIGVPAALTIMCRVAMQLTDMSMLGYLGTEYLAAASVGLIVMNALMVPIYRGIRPAVNTLCSQAVGSGNLEVAGEWFQLACVVSTLTCLPIMLIVWTCTRPLLVALGIDHSQAELARQFVSIMTIYFIPYAWYTMAQSYFQAQHIVMPALVANGVFVFVNIGLNVLFIHGVGSWGGLGFIGSPMATVTSRLCLLTCYCGYVFYLKGLHKPSWGGWTWNAFTPDRLREFCLKQALPLAVSGWMEELQLFVMSSYVMQLEPIAIATHNSLLEVFFFMSSMMFGLQNATVVRVGNYLGANNAAGAKRVGGIMFRISVGIGVFVGFMFTVFRNYVGYIYSNDPAVVALTSKLAILIGISYALLSMFYTAMAVLRGQGKPKMVAVAFVVGAWLIAVPLGYVLCFTADLGIRGVWYSLMAGYTVITFIAAGAALMSDWEDSAAKAVARSKTSVGRKARAAALSAQTLEMEGELEGEDDLL